LANIFLPYTDGWHTTVAALNSQASTYHHHFFGTLKKTAGCLIPLLARRGQCPPGYGNSDVNQIKSASVLVSHVFIIMYLFMFLLFFCFHVAHGEVLAFGTSR
jgi:hypothetical protein